MGIAHCCLRRDPQRRCTVADIASRLRVGPSAPKPATVRVPASVSWRYGILIAVVLLVAATLVVGFKLLKSRPDAPAASSVMSQPAPAPAPAAQSASPQTEPAPVATENKPSAIKQRDEHPISKPSVSPPEPPPAPASPPSGAASDHGGVLQQVEPVVSKSARNTISGTIKIRVKVDVDAAGNVENATLVTEGPSKYFARQAMEAAQQWKFAPATASGQGAPTAWILKFGFKRSGTEVDSEPANR